MDIEALSSLLTSAAEEETKTQSRPAAAGMNPIEYARMGEAAAAKASAPAPAPAKKPVDPKSIWDVDEVPDKFQVEDDAPDDRTRPEFEFLYKQAVGTEDVFLGMSNVDASSNSCNFIVAKIKLPGENHKEVDLDVDRERLRVTSPHFKLSTYLPKPVKFQDGKAQWVKDTLVVTLPIDRGTDWLNI